ncbi:uncharacterized protein [Choristoneura fumiferana]
MTRFARAKGSKASNERTPEDSTPWEVMKEQLLQSKKEKDEAGKRKEAENQRIETMKNFLKEHKVSKRKATWCDFPEEQPKKRLLPLKQPTKKHQSVTQVSNSTVETNVASQADTANKTKKKKKKKNVAVAAITPDPVHTGVTIDAGEVSQPEKKKKNKNKKKLNTNGSTQQPDIAPESNDIPMVASGEKIPQSGKKQKKKNKKKQQLTSSGNAPQDNVPASNMVKSPSQNQQNGNSKGASDSNIAIKKKQRNGKPVRRKEINDNSFQLIINGKEVELVRFEGFPIMKKDAERLTELRKSMMQKGIPKSEVQRNMKLERRRAEKALARVKRDVCYNCRKGGHNLSDCPELKSKIPGVQAADGVCFKCGSTEHRQFECKVQRDKEFRFATCFICRESASSAPPFIGPATDVASTTPFQ